MRYTVRHSGHLSKVITPRCTGQIATVSLSHALMTLISAAITHYVSLSPPNIKSLKAKLVPLFGSTKFLDALTQSNPSDPLQEADKSLLVDDESYVIIPWLVSC